MADRDDRPLTRLIRPGEEPLDLAGYVRRGGYEAARKVIGEIPPKQVSQMVQDGKLRGRGGAGFNTGMKWSFVPLGDDAPGPRYLAANADEMEPGTFKDRLLMEGVPHLLIEGMLVAAWAIQARVGYIFLRWAYKLSERRLRRAIAEAYDGGYLGRNILGRGFDFDLRIHVSAGRYMCGEETGLLNALEGRRAKPRAKPPYPQSSGLWGKPTVVQNVESLCSVPYIVVAGPEAYRALARGEDGGTKLYGASGRVKRPGIWELPMGTPLGELLHEHAGGMQDGRRFRALLPGGASTYFMTDEHLEVPMDFAGTEKVGKRLGTGTMIVVDDGACPVRMMRNLMSFYAQESCGWCTPCREGLPWARRILDAMEEGRGEPGDIEKLRELGWAWNMGYTYCGLAPGAQEPLLSGLDVFREEFEAHIARHGCPRRSS